jgi:hypothetical protein
MSHRAATASTALLVLLSLAPAHLAGQAPVRFAVGATAMQYRVHSELNGETEALSAPGLGFEGAVSVWRIALEGRYLQADLEPSTTSTLARDAAEGHVLLTVRLTPWLGLSTGPLARSYATTLGTQRWVLWTFRARGIPTLVPDLVRGYAELWGALPLDVSVPESWNSGWGGDVGLAVALPRLPVWLRFSYRIEQYRLGDGARQETIDGAVLSLGAGRLW